MTASSPYGRHQGNARQPPDTSALANAFPERQGNAKQPGAFGERRTDPHQDESDPRKPGDPPWRGRTARRSSSPAAMRALRGARLRHGWSLTRAARETGVGRPHLSLLERGLRRPSGSVAEAVIAGYRMTPQEADAVRSVAVRLAGRDSPYRPGRQHQQGGTPVLGPRRTAPQARQDAAEAAQPGQSWAAAYAPDEGSAPREDRDAEDGAANPWTAVYGTTAEAIAAQRLSELRSSPWRR